MANDLPTRFWEQIARDALLPREGTVVVGCSGRSDSVALLHLLHVLDPEWRLRLVAAHVQPDESARAREDAAFVRQLAESLDVEFDHFVAEGDREQLTGDRTTNERMRFFDHVAKRTKAAAIATGETADDLAEMLLESLISGRSVPTPNTLYPVPTVQPLASFTHEECVTFLNGRGLAWRQDPDALALADTRRKIRLLVLPLLTRHVAPEARTRLAAAAQTLAADEHFLKELTTAARAEAGWTEDAHRISLDFARWLALPLSLRLRLLSAAAQTMDHAQPPTSNPQLLALDSRCRALAGQDTLTVGPLKITRRDGTLVFESSVMSRASREIPTA